MYSVEQIMSLMVKENTNNILNYVLLTLGPAVYELYYRWRQTEILSIENQFLVTMMKLRKHYTNKDLSLMFEVSGFTISNIFVT